MPVDPIDPPSAARSGLAAIERGFDLFEQLATEGDGLPEALVAAAEARNEAGLGAALVRADDAASRALLDLLA